MDIHSAARLLGRRAGAESDTDSSSRAGEEEYTRCGKLLDVGAGDGGVTGEIAPLFEEVRRREGGMLCCPIARTGLLISSALCSLVVFEARDRQGD